MRRITKQGAPACGPSGGIRRGAGRSLALSSSSKPEIEACPARDVFAYRYASAMRPDNLHNDCQAQSGSVGTNPFAAPEALEDVRPILHWDPQAVVLDADRPVWTDLDNDFALRRRMRECILNEIAQRIGNSGSIAGDQDRMIGAGQRDSPAG